ncbi:MAG: flagellar basal body P-ring formation protein FlgA [Deltaproteobacteria bacterium]|nr:flagellar basal body P-ring formation protein FlgA [Deltaproteobacteria bacterium]
MSRFAAIFCLALSFILGANPAAATEIRFREQASVQGKWILLGEIADLRPDSEASERLAAKQIYRAPGLGREMTLKAEEVRSYLCQIDEDFRNAAWSGAGTILVTRKGMTLSSERILDIIDRYLRDSGQRLSIRRLSLQFNPSQRPKPLLLPQGELKWEVVPGDAGIIGSRSFTIIFRVDGEVVENIAIRGEVKAAAPVLVAAVDLPRGTLLSGGDLKTVTADVSKMRNPCQDADELIGKKLKRTLRAGDALEREQVAFPALVKRGQVVTVCASRGALRLSATGVARSDGREGDTIRVNNNNSGKDILCRVTGPGQVKVDY